MRTVGFFLMLLGATSYVFPLFQMRSWIMKHFGEHEPIAAGVAIGVGAILFALSFRKKKDAKK